MSVESDTPARLERHVAPVVSIRLGEGADAVQEVRIAYRHAGEARWSTLVATPEAGVATATVPLADDVAEETIEFHVEALAPSSSVIGALGSASEPLSVTVPRAAVATGGGGGGGGDEPVVATGGGSVAEEAWFWVLIGVVVVGAGVGVSVGVVLSQPGPQDGSLGNVTLPLVTF
mgnify:CR=1 FL=1